MTNAEKYHYSDFTYEAYEKLIQSAKENYVFRFFDEFKKDENFVLWRHDIDFSMHNAIDLAKIENTNGVKATYFIHPHNEFYNILEKEISDLVHELKNMGHEIGLHFDSHYYKIQSEGQLEKYINFEKEFLNKLFDINIKVFSFHNTSPFVLSCQKETYADVINTYSSYFQKQVPYCSDSYGVWRFRRLKEVLAEHTDFNLQILTHPGLWNKKILSPVERVFECVTGRANKIKKYYIDFLNANGREIIDN